LERENEGIKRTNFSEFRKLNFELKVVSQE